jgi:hypothetical protein
MSLEKLFFMVTVVNATLLGLKSCALDRHCYLYHSYSSIYSLMCIFLKIVVISAVLSAIFVEFDLQSLALRPITPQFQHFPLIYQQQMYKTKWFIVRDISNINNKIYIPSTFKKEIL